MVCKDKLKDDFTFDKMQKVFCIVIMEQSPKVFKEHLDEYRHHRYMQFNTGIMDGRTGLHEDIFLCLDIFQQNVHNVDKSSSMLDVWLTFLSATDTKTIMNLITEFPEFLPIYQEIAEFAIEPEVLLNMLSQELYIMDRNMERMMVNELREEVAEKDNTIAEQNNTILLHQQEIAELHALIDKLQAQIAQKQ